MKTLNTLLGFVVIVTIATAVVAVGVVINAVKALQLPALRWMFIVLFKLIRTADKLTFGKIKAIHSLYWPTMWLSHYLNGSGKTLVVPTEVMEQAAPLFINRCGYLIDSHNGVNAATTESSVKADTEEDQVFVLKWAHCKELTDGKSAKFKGFNGLEQTKAWMRENHAASNAFEHVTDLKQIK